MYNADHRVNDQGGFSIFLRGLLSHYYRLLPLPRWQGGQRQLAGVRKSSENLLGI